MPLIERRIGLLFAGFCVLLVLAGARALQLGGVKGGSLRQKADSQQVSDVPVPARRGTISDRKGMELAVSEPADDIAVTPYLIKDPAGAANKLAPLLHQPLDKVLRKVAQRNTGFVYLVRQLPASQAQRIAKLKMAGIQLIPSSRRIYPQRWMASQLLGAVGTDGNGLSGLEFTRDRLLRGTDGERRLVKDALGQPISLSDVEPARPGQEVRLTLDAAIQDKVESVLQQVGQKFSPRGATAVVMDPRTGAIMALANWPRVDADNLTGAPAFARQNRAIGSTYEPGSTFKAFTVAGALMDRKVTPATPFNVPPQLQVADRTLHDAHDHGYEMLTVAQILAQSSNIGAAMIGMRDGRTRFDHWVRTFGFGKPTGIDLSGEEAGIVPQLKQYSGSSMGNLPIGQGLAVTPIQMAAAYSAIANGGILRPPHVIQRVGDRRLQTPRGHRIISAATSAQLRSMLEGVLGPGGTASEASIPGYRLAGKTGTAQKPDPVRGGYSNDKFVASFVGFAPARHPRLLVTVMVDEPHGEIYGGVVAAPAFQDITKFALPYLGIPPS
ncbi:MAG: peptidoglycan D,D-transpeptidase FtsI family protein [Solirubrobacteraceae bacterium]